MSTTEMQTDEELLRDLEGQAAAPPPNESEADEAALLNEGVNPNINLETVVPAGEYLAKFAEVTVKRSQVREERDPKRPDLPPAQKGGNLMLEVKLEILQGEQEGRFVFDRLMLQGSDKATARLAKVASVLGRYDRDLKCLTGFPSNPPTAGEIKSWLIGKVVMIETIVSPARDANGKRYEARAEITFGGYHEPPAQASAPAEMMPAWK